MKGNIFLDTNIKMWVDICYITHKEVLAAEALGKNFKRTAQNPDGQMLSQGLLLIIFECIFLWLLTVLKDMFIIPELD